jgi:hypothetical protein
VLRATRQSSLVHLPSSHEQPQRAQSVIVQCCHARCQPSTTVPRNHVTTYARPSASSTIRSARRNPLSPALKSTRSFTTHHLPTRWPAQPSRAFCHTWASSRRWWHQSNIKRPAPCCFGIATRSKRHSTTPLMPCVPNSLGSIWISGSQAGSNSTSESSKAFPRLLAW